MGLPLTSTTRVCKTNSSPFFKRIHTVSSEDKRATVPASGPASLEGPSMTAAAVAPTSTARSPEVRLAEPARNHARNAVQQKRTHQGTEQCAVRATQYVPATSRAGAACEASNSCSGPSRSTCGRLPVGPGSNETGSADSAAPRAVENFRGNRRPTSDRRMESPPQNRKAIHQAPTHALSPGFNPCTKPNRVSVHTHKEHTQT
jgi:hypothetical protein